MEKRKKMTTTPIKTTDDLMGMFHLVHNVLRNGEGLAETEAMVQFNNIFSAFLLEPLLTGLTTKPITTFSELREQVHNGEVLLDQFKKMVAMLRRCKKVKEFFEPVTLKHAATLVQIIEQISRIDLSAMHEDLRGKVYEYFLGSRGDPSTKSLGQYFTNRRIVDVACKLVDLRLREDGSVPSILDPTCGTGGFLLHSANILKDQGLAMPKPAAMPKPTMPKPFDWSGINSQRMVGYDASPSYIRTSKINMLCATGTLFPHIIQRNTFSSDIEGEFDYVLGNPPYAGSAVTYSTANKSIKAFGVETNVKECLFVQLMAQKLAPGGSCAVVIPNGLLFKRTAALVRFRERLIREYEVKTVVELSNDAFENTKTQTCLLVFRRRGADSDPVTQRVEFKNANLDTICAVPLAVLEKSSFQLISMPYVEHAPSAGFHRLGNVATITYGTRIVKKKTKPGPYDVYGGGDATFTTEQVNRDQDTTCKISRFGISESNCVMLLHGKYYLNDSGMTITSKDESVLLNESLWCGLLQKKKEIYAMGRGTAQKNLDCNELLDMMIAIPEPAVQETHRQIVSKRARCVQELRDIDASLVSAA
jgi:hypothetical protein